VSDRERVGDPRTLADHDEWRARQVMRQQAQDTDVVAAQRGLRVATIVRTRADGSFMIDTFNDPATGTGVWFSAANFTQPRMGESVIWGYVDGSPAVLGPVPGPNRPWRVPSSGLPDTYHHDDFDVGSINDLVGLGTSRFTYETSAGSTVSLGAGDENHSGIVTLTANTTANESSHMFLPADTLHMDSLKEIEFMVKPSLVTGCLFDVGLLGMNSGGSGFLVRYDTNNASFLNGWTIVLILGGSTLSTTYTTPIVPIVAGHWYVVNFLRNEKSVWTISIIDITASPTIEGALTIPSVFSSNVTPYLRAYSRSATGVKQLAVDYVWWARRMMVRT
jgi:hypothetical protein